MGPHELGPWGQECSHTWNAIGLQKGSKTGGILGPILVLVVAHMGLMWGILGIVQGGASGITPI